MDDADASGGAKGCGIVKGKGVAEFRERLERIKGMWDGPRVAEALGLGYGLRRGRRVFCPGCQPTGGRTPDLAIYDWGFRCYKCGAHGDVVALVQWARPWDFRTAVQWLAAPVGMSASDNPTDSATRHSYGFAGKTPKPGSQTLTALTGLEERAEVFEDVLAHCPPPSGDALARLTARGIAPEVIRAAGVRVWPGDDAKSALKLMNALCDRWGVKRLCDVGLLRTKRGDGPAAPTFGPYFSAGVPFLIFPYVIGGRPAALKARATVSATRARVKSVPRFLNTGGPVPCLYNGDILHCPLTPAVLICEGETDTLSALSRGFAAVGIPGWSGFKSLWADRLIGKTVYLVMDGDSAGRQGICDAAAKLLRRGVTEVFAIELPTGMDLNDYVRPPDGDAVRGLMRRMQSRGLRVVGNPNEPLHEEIIHPRPRIGPHNGRILWQAPLRMRNEFPAWPHDPRLDQFQPVQPGWSFFCGEYSHLCEHILVTLLERDADLSPRPRDSPWWSEHASELSALIDGDEEMDTSCDTAEIRQAVLRYRRRLAVANDHADRDENTDGRELAGAVTTPSGRTISLMDTDADITVRGVTALSRRVRGAAADIVNRAALWLDHLFRNSDAGAELAWVWFDEIRIAAPADDPAVLPALQERMIAAAAVDRIDCPVRLYTI